MAVEILKSVLVHEAIVLGICIGRPARSDGFADHVIDRIASLAGEAHQHLRALFSIADLFRGKLLELRPGQQHDVNVFADDHARSRLICELRIELETEFGEEFHGPFQIIHWQIHEDLCRHFYPLFTPEAVESHEKAKQYNVCLPSLCPAESFEAIPLTAPRLK